MTLKVGALLLFGVFAFIAVPRSVEAVDFQEALPVEEAPLEEAPEE